MECCVEGTQLNMLTPTDKNKSDREAFVSYLLMFTNLCHFNVIITPLSKRTHGPEWFTREFPSIDEREAESKKIWAAFLTPRLLSTRLGSSKEVVKILCYQPNLVLHQFGISQTKPKSFFNRKSDVCLCMIDYSEDDYLRRITQHANDRPKLTPFSLQLSFYCTPEINPW